MVGSMSAIIRTSKGPPFIQPAGSWRERGAGSLSLRLGMGLEVDAGQLGKDALGENDSPLPPKKGAKKRVSKGKDFALRETDHIGNTLWHYWADSPNPIKRFHLLLKSRWWAIRDQTSARGEHPWHRLAIHGHADALEAWAAHAQPSDIECTTDGDTVIHHAAWSSDENTVAFAIAQSSCEHLSARDASGLTPLMVAVHRCSNNVIEALLKAGADPNVTDSQGRNALHHAAMHADSERFALLERLGGDIEAGDTNGLSPRDVLHAKRELSDRDRESLRVHWARRAAAKATF